jgi:trehalose synthase
VSREIAVSPVSPECFRSVVPADRFQAFERRTVEARELLRGRVVWNVNSTAVGGGVVELLRSLVAYARGAGVDVRWVVIDGSPEFFAVTKRIHNRLHGVPGDGRPLDDDARRVYEGVLAGNLQELAGRVRPGDIVIVHDPQPAGMVAALRDAGASVIWRCHIGLDNPNELARETWAFLRPYIEEANVYVFSRASFAWKGLDRNRIAVIAPSIDVFSPKNQALDADMVLAVLRAGGLVADECEPRTGTPVMFKHHDGTADRVERRAHMIEDEPLGAEMPVVLQVSRWDALKDPIGVIRGFAEHVAPDTGAHLLYAGPAVAAVADDPEGTQMLRESIGARERLAPEARRRVHLASLPMDDPDENAILVNALQRHARVVVQKSLAEGFGLTVAEAMWKARPVVASRIGGIQDQIVHGVSGLLLDDPRNLEDFGAAITGLLRDVGRARQLGSSARERVRDRFLSVRNLDDYLDVIRPLLAAPNPSSPASGRGAGSCQYKDAP